MPETESIGRDGEPQRPDDVTLGEDLIRLLRHDPEISGIVPHDPSDAMPLERSPHIADPPGGG